MMFIITACISIMGNTGNIAGIIRHSTRKTTIRIDVSDISG